MLPKTAFAQRIHRCFSDFYHIFIASLHSTQSKHFSHNYVFFVQLYHTFIQNYSYLSFNNRLTSVWNKSSGMSSSTARTVSAQMPFRTASTTDALPSRTPRTTSVDSDSVTRRPRPCGRAAENSGCRAFRVLLRSFLRIKKNLSGFPDRAARRAPARQGETPAAGAV